MAETRCKCGPRSCCHFAAYFAEGASTLPDVPVQEAARCNKNGVRNKEEYPSQNLNLPRGTPAIRSFHNRIAPIRQHRPDRTQTIFELHQAGMTQLGAAEIKHLHTLILDFLNGRPKEVRGTAEPLIPLIRAAVLVRNRSLV